MRKILCAFLLYVFMSLFLSAQAEIYLDDLNDESADIESSINLLESTMTEWQESKYKNRFIACRIVVEWTYLFRIAKPKLLDKIATEIENRSMETTNYYAEKCVVAIDDMPEQGRDKNVYDVVMMSLVKIGLISPENAQLLD